MSPGVGAYNIISFSSCSKASGTNFDLDKGLVNNNLNFDFCY